MVYLGLPKSIADSCNEVGMMNSQKWESYSRFKYASLERVVGISALRGPMWSAVAVSIAALVVAGSSLLIRPSAPITRPVTILS